MSPTSNSRPSTPRPASRQSHRIKKASRKSTHLPTPRGSQSPSPSRPSTPIASANSENRRKLPAKKVQYTKMTAAQQPTVNWDCVSYVISDQKIHSAYEKPTFAPGSTTTVTAYGRVVTTTTTTTVTTTIATTEILHPGEKGYEESVARQAAQAAASPEERARIEKSFATSRAWSAGSDKSAHEEMHRQHHRAAEPQRPIITQA
ncbi:hypothetical protein FN846DRAFT_953480 [Sphaerosporella brunnea]|uniref:Uncharacterized protein n=1 Tax=Sphaerosporella brunnea TaxID=1250544 RepID=A0A5J5EVJ3_9PEZI|nr:hypothetical protein FN846DRAFT_953480 [Sphaerosporella brunnea]